MSKFWLLAAALLAPGMAAAAERALVPAQSEITFSVKQMGVAVSGAFRRYTARIDLDEKQLEKSSAQIEIDTASLSTGDDEADGVARDKAWLDTAGFPKAAFRSSSVRALGGGRYEARGALTIKGKSRELNVPFTLKNSVASGEFVLKRVEFGIGGGEWNEGDLVAPDVAVRFRLQLAP